MSGNARLITIQERVFAGEYDHLPSDDDATPSGAMGSDTGLAVSRPVIPH